MENEILDALKTMDAADVVSSKLASCYIVENGNRYLLFQAKKLSAKIKKNKVKVALLGRIGAGNKSTSVEYSGSLTIYHNTALFDKMVEKYLKTGVDTYFDMQVVNNDPTSKAGRRSVILKGVNLDELTAAEFDAEGKYIEQEHNFTYEGVKYVQHFNELDGMQA